MKRTFSPAALLVAALLTVGLFPLNAVCAEVIPFDSDRWEITAAEHKIEDYQGQKALLLREGFALVKDSADFLNGIIEFDIAIPAERGFSGAVWRVKDLLNYEEFYLRHHQSGNDDANQYSPVYNGLAAWQLYYSGDGFGYPLKYDFNQWMHVKIVVSGKEAEMYVKDMETPIVYMPELRRGADAGKVGVYCQFFAPARYANFSLTKMDNPPMKRAAREVQLPPGPVGQQALAAKKMRGAGPAAPGTVMSWQVSKPVSYAELDKKYSLGETDLAGQSWVTMPAESTGLILLARLDGAAQALKEKRNAVFARFTVVSDKDQVKKLEFGFSDMVKVYFNKTLLFGANDSYASRDYRFLGTIGYYDELYLPLKKGENEIMMAVGEIAGGWGVKARFENLDGLSIK